MAGFKLFKSKKRSDRDPAAQMRALEMLMKKTDKKSFYRGDGGKKK